jgi:TolB protein
VSAASVASDASAVEVPPVALPGEPWFVYQGGASEPARVRLVRPDGTDDHIVVDVSGDGEQQHPDWSHDGNRLAMAIDDPDGTKDLWIVDADGSDAQRVADCVAPCVWMDDPSWAPDDSAIAYQQGTRTDAQGNGTGSIEVVDVASRTTRRVWAGAPIEWPQVPRWSPDGRAIVFWLQRFGSARLDDEDALDGTIGIVSLGSDRPTFHPLRPWGSHAWYPDWNPLGSRILYVAPATTSTKGEFWDIHLIGADKGGDVTVTSFGPAGGRAIQPSWTPDGRSIVFTAEQISGVSRPNIATIRADGSGFAELPESDLARTHARLRPTP